MLKKIPLLDDDNHIVGETTISEAYANNNWRRSVRIFLFNQANEMLLQKRSENSITHPGLWSQAADGHVDIGETYIEAARRELGEEIGVDVPLHEVVTALRFDLPSDKTFTSVFVGTLDKSTEIALGTDEVAEVKWIELEEFEVDLKLNPSIYTPGLIAVWQRCRDNIHVI